MGLSPMMQQYMSYKEQYKDALLFFRLGDFYEMFFEDAKTASRELGLTLTGRDCGEAERAPMCGVPYHAADTYIGRLVAKGYKVVICEQMEDPATAKGIVRRDVVRIVTPGTVTDEKQLDASQNNYLCAIYLSVGEAALSFADITTGDLFLTAFAGEDCLTRAMNELSGYSPKEVILNTSVDSYPALGAFLRDRLHVRVSDNMTGLFAPENTESAVRKHARDRKELQNATPSQLLAMGALFSYIDDSLKCDSFLLKSLQVYSEGQYLSLDGNTRRNLRALRDDADAQKKGSLPLRADKSKTAMGARLLRKNVEMPLVSIGEISRRQDAVEELASDYMLREELGDVLKDVLDLDRLLTKVLYGTAGGKELRSICDTLKTLPRLKELLAGANAKLLCSLRDSADLLEDVRDLLDRAIKQKDVPFSVREGGFIADGYNAEVDRLRSVTGGAKEILEKMEASEREKTGIRTLRVGYNRVFGYYIEVSKSFTGQVPGKYVRKQTLSGR